MLGLCFCEHCLAGAEKAGIDARRFKAEVAADIGAYLDSDIDYPADMAEAFWRADIAADGDLRRYLDFRSGVVTSLVAEIRAAVRKDADVAVIPSVARPTGGAWYEGSDLGALAEDGGHHRGLLLRAERRAREVRSVRHPPAAQGQTASCAASCVPRTPTSPPRASSSRPSRRLRDGGVDELAFYNWGHLRRANLAWIGDAMRGAA